MGRQEGWTASEADQLRMLLKLSIEDFSRRLRIHKRTVIRWRDGETDPAVAFWEDLDKLLLEAVRKLAPWLALDQLDKMHRRDVLKLLSASSTVPLGGIDLLWNGTFTQVSHTTLTSLEDITTVLAGKYHTTPPHMLLGSVMGHLEKASAFLSGTITQSSQRRRLESIVADLAIFVGVLSMQSGKLAQSGAHFGLAEDMAGQAGNLALLAQAYAQQALLDYYSQMPGGGDDNLRQRVERLAYADQLAGRYAPAIVQLATSGWLAEDQAATQDGYDADKALERSARALDCAQGEGAVGHGFCSTSGFYQGWGEDRLAGFRGSVDLALKRTSAIDTITASLDLPTSTRWRANTLVDLGLALIAQKQPEEACDRLTEAHIIGVNQGSAVILHHVFRARALMPPAWNRLKCVRELDDRLRSGWTK